MNEINKIQHVIENYFQATYQGDAAVIASVFTKGAVICGFIDSEFYQWSVSEFAANIMGRSIAADIGAVYDKQVLAVDVFGDVARVKAPNLAGETMFLDQMNVARIKNEWKIVNKLFSPIA